METSTNLSEIDRTSRWKINISTEISSERNYLSSKNLRLGQPELSVTTEMDFGVKPGLETFSQLQSWNSEVSVENCHGHHNLPNLHFIQIQMGWGSSRLEETREAWPTNPVCDLLLELGSKTNKYIKTTMKDIQ